MDLPSGWNLNDILKRSAGANDPAGEPVECGVSLPELTESLGALALTLGTLRELLLAQGFATDEAFELVRDYHKGMIESVLLDEDA